MNPEPLHDEHGTPLPAQWHRTRSITPLPMPLHTLHLMVTGDSELTVIAPVPSQDLQEQMARPWASVCMAMISGELVSASEFCCFVSEPCIKLSLCFQVTREFCSEFSLDRIGITTRSILAELKSVVQICLSVDIHSISFKCWHPSSAVRQERDFLDQSLPVMALSSSCSAAVRRRSAH